MGNRAVITNGNVDIYIHWNGGIDSVTAFLKYCELRKFRSDDYGMARLTQVIANFFGGDLSIGITGHDTVKHCDLDNGTYFIKDWQIVEHDGRCEEEYHEGYDLTEMLVYIDGRQPEADRLGEEVIRQAINAESSLKKI